MRYESERPQRGLILMDDVQMDDLMIPRSGPKVAYSNDMKIEDSKMNSKYASLSLHRASFQHPDLVCVRQLQPRVMTGNTNLHVRHVAGRL